MTDTPNFSIADRLATLNTLRSLEGKAPLAQWKNSRAELEQRIADLTPAPVGVVAHNPPAPDLAAVAAAIAAAPVTKVAATAPELNTKRKDAIEKLASDAVKNDTPANVIDIKAASRKVAKSMKKPTKSVTSTKATVTKASPKKAATSTPKGTNEFGAYLVSIKMDAKIARAKLRRAGFSAPYTVNAALKAALSSDSRKK